MATTEMGEYAVGAWLREIERCDFVNYNVRPPVSGQEGQFEFDVVGFHFEKRVAYLCEAGTHILGLKYGNYEQTFERVHERERIPHEDETVALAGARGTLGVGGAQPVGKRPS